MPYSFKCPICGKEFTSDFKQKHCSRACSAKNLGNLKRKKITFEIDPKTNCYINTSHPLNTQGYPRISVNGKRILLHRFIYEQCFGEIPEGMIICHKCDNPKCINPEHLFVGTFKKNYDDMVNKGRRKILYGEKHGNSKLTKNEVLKIRNSNLPYYKLASLYKVGWTTIYHIKKNESWAWLK